MNTHCAAIHNQQRCYDKPSARCETRADQANATVYSPRPLAGEGLGVTAINLVKSIFFSVAYDN